MLMFQLHIAFILEAASVCVGLITLHKAGKEPPAGLLRTAGYLFIVAGILSATCSLYFGIKYQVQGDFDRGTLVAPHCMDQPCPMMRPGMMPGGKMMDGMAPKGGGTPPVGADSVPVAPTPSAPATSGDPHHPSGKT